MKIETVEIRSRRGGLQLQHWMTPRIIRNNCEWCGKVKSENTTDKKKCGDWRWNRIVERI